MTRAPARLPSGTVTFLLTDIEGSTWQWASNPTAMREALRLHNRLLAGAIRAAGGVVVTSRGEGDSFFAVFPGAGEAVGAAGAAQRKLQAQAWPEGTEIRVRMAMHTGEAELRGGEYHGHAAINRCARLRAIAHGGQVLLSGTTHDLAGQNLPRLFELRALGEHRLRDLAGTERVFQLAGPGLAEDFPALRSVDARAGNLTVRLSSFVGRLVEIVEVRRLLSQARLVTLTGAGGIGKTRLALEVAGQVLEEWQDGAWLVELASLVDPALVPRTLLAALGLREQTGQSATETLLGFLRNRRLLLLMDNCEHLLEPCARLADDLLTGCAQLRILATSREALGVEGEIAWRVPSMAAPDVRTPPAAGDLEGYEAVKLFVERAVAVRSDFSLTDGAAAAVASICQRLDGIPLAIELAAARIRLIPAEEIDERLRNRFQLLTGGSRTAMARQQTLRATLEWSHDPLTTIEKTLFRRLSVFAGGFGLGAAESVGAGAGLDGLDVLETLSALVDKSLVLSERGARGEGRYALLETIREYGFERLVEAGETATTRTRHARHYLAFAIEAEPALSATEQAILMGRIREEIDNLRAAMDWLLIHDGSSALGLAAALERYWMLGHSGEGRDWLSRALASCPDQDRLRAKALNAACWLAWQQGDLQVARLLGQECLELAEGLDDALFMGRALNRLGIIEYSKGDDPAPAIALLERAEPLLRRAGDGEGLAMALNDRGLLSHLGGRSPAGRVLVEEALALARRSGDLWATAMIMDSLASIELDTGDYGSARDHWHGCLLLTQQLHDNWTVIFILDGIGRLALAQAQPEVCLRLRGAAVAMRERIGAVLMAGMQGQDDETSEQALRLLDPDAAAAASEAGARMSLDEVVEYALELTAPGARVQAMGEQG